MNQDEAGANDRVTECVRNIYGEARDWYKVAETKAQILLTLDGVAITTLASIALGDPQDLRQRLGEFPLGARFALALSLLAFIASILCAIACVRSRLYSERQLDVVLADHSECPVAPPTIWFFQFYTRHNPEDVLDRLQFDRLAEARAMLANLSALSASVTRKHRYVNQGFSLAVVAVILLLAAATLTVGGRV